MGRHLVFAAVIAASVSGCGLQSLYMPENARYPAGARQHDEQVVADAAQQMDAQIDSDQAQLEAAMKAALGQQAPYPGADLPKAAPDAIADMREAKIDISIKPVLDGNGNPVANQYMQLTASPTALQHAATHVHTFTDLQGQVRMATLPAMVAGFTAITSSITVMNTVADMIRNRRQAGATWSDQDYELVRRLLERQNRRHAVAALSVAMLGTYEAVVNGGSDPEIIEDVAKAGSEALPLEGKASLDDAKQYVDHFNDNVAATEELYETNAHHTGNAAVDGVMQTHMDQVFAQAKMATMTGSPRPPSSGNLLDALPGVHQLKLVCEGVAALQDGDPLKALQIASDLAPIPGVQSALKGASAAAATEQKLSRKE